MLIHGIDFTSAPGRRKPIVIASGRFDRGVLQVDQLTDCREFASFEAWLRLPGPWIGGFDFPFGLPRLLVQTLGWPTGTDTGHRSPWESITRRLAAHSRAQLVELFRAFCNARPAGSKFAHRATDLPAGSSPSMKWVNPPVAFMLHAGAPRLLDAGLWLPALHDGDDAQRIGLEAYPGMLARAVLGHQSYKSDLPARRADPLRRARRRQLVAALADAAMPVGVRVRLAGPVAARCVDEANGDALDAVLCLAQAGWAWQRRDAGFGLPAQVDPIEGWIAGA